MVHGIPVLVGAVAAMATCAWALPTATVPATTATPTVSPHGLRIPIRVNTEAKHPRNKRMEPDELVEWLDEETSKLRVKYTHPKDRHSSSRSKRQQVGLGDSGADSYYFAPIGIGTPVKTMDVVLDTGSADFWVADSSCSTAQNCPSAMNKYDSSKSNTYDDTHTQFQVQYGSGAVKGTLATDSVSLAGYNISSVSFGQASHLAKNTIRPPASGIMGMGFDTLSTTGTMPFWQILTVRHKLHDYLFSFQLTTNFGSVKSTEEVNAGGVFTLGVLDSQQYSGELTWVPLAKGYGPDGLGYWAIDIDKMSVNGRELRMGNMGIAAIDTGTTLIGGPQRLVEQIHSIIPGARPLQQSSQYYSFPCKQKFEVEFVFGGRSFKLSNDDLNLGPASTFGSSCVSAIFVSPTQSDRMPAWIVGDSFLKTVFSAFGSSPPSVGFANLPKGGAQTLSLTSVPMPSGGRDSASEQPFGGGGDGGGGGGPLGGGSVAKPEPNTDKSWQTASVEVPNHVQPLSPAGGSLGGGARGVRAAGPGLLCAAVAVVAAVVLL
ncbi:cathepsin D [Malassezia caprae]|uniref:Cathepsin D n=1 Tax=Malassezia caprae TaxID=1381934 RepID=A0AAF0EB24_9BASI|nr:cathepsin D [Malassezia caprae]